MASSRDYAINAGIGFIASFGVDFYLQQIMGVNVIGLGAAGLAAGMLFTYYYDDRSGDQSQNSNTK